MLPAHQAFVALLPWLDEGVDALTPACLSACATACAEPPCTDTGAAIHFAATAAAVSAADYEMQILRTGAVPTRHGNRHDTFNALCWIAYPGFKRACNALHAAHVKNARGASGTPRGPVRDALTLLDESGVIVLCADPVLAGLLIQRQWKTLFWERRADVGRALRFFVCGHALFEKLLQPYPAITARALIVPAPVALFERGLEAQRHFADEGAAHQLRAGISSSQAPPLPLAAIPGWDPGNRKPGFYANRAVFRPLQSATAAGNAATSAHSECAPARVNSSDVP
jgi:Protein of unknown function (DUF3025)